MRLITTGILIVIAFAVLLFSTGNVFKDARKWEQEHKTLAQHSDSLSEKDRQKLIYYNLNSIIREVGFIGMFVGLAVAAIGLFNSLLDIA